LNKQAHLNLAAQAETIRTWPLKRNLATIVQSLLKMAEHDLTSKLGNYLDQHLVFPLFEFLAVQGVSLF